MTVEPRDSLLGGQARNKECRPSEPRPRPGGTDGGGRARLGPPRDPRPTEHQVERGEEEIEPQPNLAGTPAGPKEKAWLARRSASVTPRQRGCTNPRANRRPPARRGGPGSSRTRPRASLTDAPTAAGPRLRRTLSRPAAPPSAGITRSGSYGHTGVASFPVGPAAGLEARATLGPDVRDETAHLIRRHPAERQELRRAPHQERCQGVARTPTPRQARSRWYGPPGSSPGAFQNGELPSL